MRPICIECNCEFHCHKNGAMVHIGNNNYYRADMWKCPNCGHEILCGFGKTYYESKKHDPKLVVADLDAPVTQW